MKNICTLKNFNLEICELMRNDDGCVSLFNSYIDKLPDPSGSMLSLHDSTVSHIPYRYSKEPATFSGNLFANRLTSGCSQAPIA